MTKRVSLLLLLATLLIGGAFRFYLIKDVPLGLAPEEAAYGNYALEAIATGDVRLFYPELGISAGVFVNLLAFALNVLGNAPWVLRLVSALVGTITMLGVYLVAKELFYKRVSDGRTLGIPYADTIALTAAFFLAASFWHISFSRLGLSVILLPFFAAFSMYFLLRGLRTGHVAELIGAGAFTGLGFYGSGFFYTMLPVFALPLGRALWRWYRRDEAAIPVERSWTRLGCAPCAVTLFLFVALVVALPVTLQMIQAPEVMAEAAGESAAGLHIVRTLQMLFLQGDCDWRYNLACQPALAGVPAFFAAAGLAATAFTLFKGRGWEQFVSALLGIWFVSALLPAILTPRHVPDALGALGAVVPTMLIAAFGAASLLAYALGWLEMHKSGYPERSGQLLRIQREIILALPLLLLIVALQTHRAYFIDWAYQPQTYDALGTPLVHIGQYLNDAPPEAKKYVVANIRNTSEATFPMPLHTVMFVTNTFPERERSAKRFTYLVPGDNLARIVRGEPTVIIPLDGYDRDFIAAVRRNFPEFKLTVPGDFLVFQNF
ncbi:MAG: hypothetical protein Q8R13_05610 [bacterium]|nr:hypothetical protein [bacterium]MDZ4296471.1 hypothetical protein [Patescibacteria group bacterium]